MTRGPWIYVAAGDVGFDGGGGPFGWIIRRATGSYGHTWVYDRFLYVDGRGREVWRTVEAGPSGIKYRTRAAGPVKVVRMWRTQAERAAIVEASRACVGRKYGWGEIVRLALHTVGIRVGGWRDNPKRMICSNHVAHAVTAGVPSLLLTLPYPPPHIWPQRLAEWCDWVLWTRARAGERYRSGELR